MTCAELALSASNTAGIEIEYSANLFISNATFNSFLCPPRNVISEIPSIRDNFSIVHILQNHLNYLDLVL